MVRFARKHRDPATALRARAVAATAGGRSRHAVAAVLCCAVSTVVRAVARFAEVSVVSRTELEDANIFIRSQNEALVRAQEQRRRLTAMIVHDLKNPLTAIVSNSTWLLAQVTGERHAALQDVMSSAATMHRMVLDLLDIDRSTDGALLPNLSRIDLRVLVAECIRSIPSSVEGTPAIRPSIADDVTEVLVDRDLMRRVIENLLDNSMKYSPRNGAIRIEALREDGGWLIVRIRDECRGIPKAQREEIFQPYKRLDRDRDSHSSSSRGLGLAFCRLAIEAHGGRIWVDDNSPTGSVFCIRLPDGSQPPGGAAVRG